MDEEATGTESYIAKRYAVKYEPPCVFVEYEDSSTRRRVRAVKLNGIQANVDVDRLTRKVIRSFPRKLEPSSVKYDQVRKLVVKLVEYLGAHNQDKSSRSGCGGYGPASSPPHNYLAVRQLHHEDLSPMMAISPRLAALSSGGGGHNGRFSVDSSMSRFSTSTGDGSSDEETGGEIDGDGDGGGGGLGELASALDNLQKEMEMDMNIPGPYGHSSRVNGSKVKPQDEAAPTLVPAASVAVGGLPQLAFGSGTEGTGPVNGKSRFAAEAEKLAIRLEVTAGLDLNKVTELELKLAKQAMESDFKKNQLRPGDPGYVYDKQAEFGPPTEYNDWDDDDDNEALPSEEPDVDSADIQTAVRKPVLVVPV